MWRGVVLGALAAVGLSFPVATLMALVFRFPIPFSGYASGIAAVVPAMFAVLFYGIVGGFALLGLLGGVAGAIVFHRKAGKGRPYWRPVVLSCLAIDVVALFVLAILDKLVGQW